MISFRYETFIELCKVKNYTKTAELLHMTQPAVTQHIKYLEKIYGKLFSYTDKVLTLTNRGEILFEYTQRMLADSNQIKEIVTVDDNEITISFGATLTIGEFIMPSILSRAMNDSENLHFNMFVENTKSLLEKLKTGEISFALLEGHFDKSKYGYKLFSLEDFIGICSAKSSIKNGKQKLEDLLGNRLILRESGSGTRDILEHVLYEKNFSKDSFSNVIEIGNMNAIKELVTENEGITFMYKAAVKKEISTNKLFKIDIEDFDIKHEFNFVYLKDSIHENQYINWFSLLKK